MTVGLAGLGDRRGDLDLLRGASCIRSRSPPSPMPPTWCFPVGACAALLLFPGEHSTQSRGRLFLDGVIVAASLFLVSWVTILHPLYLSDDDQSAGVRRLAGLSDIRHRDPDGRRGGVGPGRVATTGLSLTLLTAGLACIALSDSAFTYLAAKDAIRLRRRHRHRLGGRPAAHHRGRGRGSRRHARRARFARAARLGVDVVALHAAAGGRHRRGRPTRSAAADPARHGRRGPAGGGRPGPPIPGGEREPPAGGDRRRAGAARSADRAGQSRAVQRASRPCNAIA